MNILVTGGSGFIGSAFIRFIINNTNYSVLNLDKLTYAGNSLNLVSVEKNNRYSFIRGDISDRKLLKEIYSTYKPNKVINFAAESHVDRSIDHSMDFIQTNIFGTYVLIEEFESFLSKNKIKNPLFLHISTDEVYGDLLPNDPPFDEKKRYEPSSPYSASKASSDHLVMAWHKTFRFPSIITNCSNNYGPYQYPEKLIPLIIQNAIRHKPLPIYGNGLQIRDWLYVDDHVRAIYRVLMDGRLGETYNIGGNNEKTNLDVVGVICDSLDSLLPLDNAKIKKY